METRTRPGIENVALLGFFFFTAAALLGYWNFGLNPQRLPQEPWAIRVYQLSFPWFARGQIIVSAIALAIAFWKFARLRWIPAFIAVFVLSFLAEHIGTGYGFPFSGYRYTQMLGPRLLDRVPWLIPISWFLMSAPSWILARRAFRGPGRRAQKILFATWLLVLWDLALDPAMSLATNYWIWETPGAFYGMPWVNVAGWFGTGLVLMTALSLLDDRSAWSEAIPTRWSALYYGVILLMPLGMVTLKGYVWSTLATLAALGVAWGVARFVRAADDRQAGVDPGLRDRTPAGVVEEAVR